MALKRCNLVICHPEKTELQVLKEIMTNLTRLTVTNLGHDMDIQKKQHNQATNNQTHA